MYCFPKVHDSPVLWSVNSQNPDHRTYFAKTDDGDYKLHYMKMVLKQTFFINKKHFKTKLYFVSVKWQKTE